MSTSIERVWYGKDYANLRSKIEQGIKEIWNNATKMAYAEIPHQSYSISRRNICRMSLIVNQESLSIQQSTRNYGPGSMNWRNRKYIPTSLPEAVTRVYNSTFGVTLANRRNYK